jgi:hypothetical protein
VKSYKDLIKDYKDLDLDLNSSDISLYRYENENGDFDYDLYREAQTRVNLEKIDYQGPDPKRIRVIAKHIKKNIPNLKYALCHGTRNGTEQISFKTNFQKMGVKYFEILGTEISHTATQFPYTIQWDFHDVKEEWKGNVCFIYSNSLDHSYNPVACLKAWMSCIKPGGKIYIQRGGDDKVNTRFYKKFGSSSLELKEDEKPPADIFQSNDECFDKIVKVAGESEWTVSRPNELILNWPHKQEDLKLNGIKRVVVLSRDKEDKGV